MHKGLPLPGQEYPLLHLPRRRRGGQGLPRRHLHRLPLGLRGGAGRGALRRRAAGGGHRRPDRLAAEERGRAQPERLRRAGQHLAAADARPGQRAPTPWASCSNTWARTGCCGGPTRSGTARPRTRSPPSAPSRSRPSCGKNTATPRSRRSCGPRCSPSTPPAPYRLSLEDIKRHARTDWVGRAREAYAELRAPSLTLLGPPHPARAPLPLAPARGAPVKAAPAGVAGLAGLLLLRLDACVIIVARLLDPGAPLHHDLQPGGAASSAPSSCCSASPWPSGNAAAARPWRRASPWAWSWSSSSTRSPCTIDPSPAR